MINDRPNPVLNGLVVNVSCFGDNTGSISLTVNSGTPNFSFNWSDGGRGQSRSNLSAGSYTATVTDANGCTDSRTFTVSQPSQALTLGGSISQPSCSYTNNGSINLTVSGGTPGYSYEWSNGGRGQDLSGLSGGTYTVTVTDSNGCEETTSFTLTQPTQIILDETIVNVDCSGRNNGSISVSVTGGTRPRLGYDFRWSNGATTSEITDLSGGNYSLTVTDANGCIATATYSVEEPNPLSVTVSDVRNVSCLLYTSPSPRD